MAPKPQPKACATCGEPSAPRSTNKHAPFCSGRCKDEDLGRWFGEGYRISRPATPYDARTATIRASDD